MSEQTTCIILTIVVAGIFFAWMPLLNFICPPCSRFLERRRMQKTAAGQHSYHVDNGQHTSGLK